MFKFEKLSVGQKGLDFAHDGYRASQGLPSAERFGLTNQIRRAATSISSNFAEGSARPDPDFARFIGYATRSRYEVVTRVYIARRKGFLDEAEFQQRYSEADEIGRMLSGLRGSLGG